MPKEEENVAPVSSAKPPNKKARKEALPVLGVAPSSAPSSDNATATATKDVDNANDETSSPPSYGSQEYWEQRYQKQQQQQQQHDSIDKNVDENNTMGDNTKGDPDNKDNGDSNNDVSGASPFHAWYFTYQDLRPLILPLILGGREEARGVMDEALADTDADADALADAPTATAVPVGDENHKINESSEGAQKGGADDAQDDSEEDDNGNANESEELEEEEGADEDEEDEEDGDFEEFGDDDDEDEEEEVDREGLATNGPISVLEVGCGDVPLGADLSIELQKLEQETGGSSQGIVKRIVCIDYSETVVHAMTKLYLLSAPSTTTTATTTTDTTLDTDKSGGPLEFAVEDARRLSYPNESFELILEKGTLDAMLSNKEDGVANCVEIVTECARVLTMGGFIVIISHLNAHTPNGVSWLEEVVQTGLRAGGGNATWEIEVHGNADISEEGDPGIPAGSPGPAVYIIQKKSPPEIEGSESATASTSPTQDTTIPVKFFAY